MKKILAAAITVALSGCASDPANITAASVSPMQYSEYNCKQINAELGRVNVRKADLHVRLKEKADNDAVQMGVGMLLLWPTLFFLEGGDGPEAAEYSRLKGEQEALEKTAIEKQCMISQTAPLPKEEPKEPEPL